MRTRALTLSLALRATRFVRSFVRQELTVEANPSVVVDVSTSKAQMLTTRLAELVGWALVNFAPGAHAYTMARDVHMEAIDVLLRLGADLRMNMVAELLGPFVGILVALHRGSTQCAGYDSFLEQMFELGITDKAFVVCVNLVNNADLSRLGPLSPAELKVVYEIIRRLQQKAAEQRRKSVLLEPPEAFLDPLLNQLMTDPVILPSGVTLDRKTIQRHLANSATDPYTQQALKEEDLVDDVELRRKVRAWIDQADAGAADSAGDSAADSAGDDDPDQDEKQRALDDFKGAIANAKLFLETYATPPADGAVGEDHG